MKIGRLFCLVVLSFAFLLSPLAGQPAAHPPGDWIKSGVIYEVTPRTFSAAGDFRGVEQRLDYLKDLGVTILWIMPIYPVGLAKKKGSIGSAGHHLQMANRARALSQGRSWDALLR